MLQEANLTFAGCDVNVPKKKKKKKKIKQIKKSKPLKKLLHTECNLSHLVLVLFFLKKTLQPPPTYI